MKISLWTTALIFGWGMTAAAQTPLYPAAAPQVIETPDSVKILFPQQVGIVLQRRPGKFFSGIARLWVGSHPILSMPAGYDLPPFLVMMDDDSVGGITNWPAYLLQRRANNNTWPQVGGRAMWSRFLDSAQYVGYQIDGDTVRIQTTVTIDSSVGTLEWIFMPVTSIFGLQNFQGVGWKVRLTGLPRAVWLSIYEPIATRNGDWVFAQLWGRWFEMQIGDTHQFHFDEPKWYFADMQPFYFAAGGQGVAMGGWADVIGALVENDQEAGRHFLLSHIPLGKGNVRETPMRFWIWRNQGVGDKWAAVNAWTAAYDTIGAAYRQSLNLGQTIPQPTIFWGQPTADYFERYHLGQVDTFWLDDFRRNQLPTLAEKGFRVIFLHTPWESDADHPPSDYLTGSGCWGSGNAPWRFSVSPAIGGKERMKSLIQRAHQLGVRIVFWSSPGHLSNSSPLLVQHPEWIKWRYTGTPEDFDYGDVTGTSQHGGYYPYAIQEYQRTFSALGYDGIWQDSYLTFGVLPDYREQQPNPTLLRSTAMQQAFWTMGMTEVYIEGCGPLGLSSGGYGHEPPIPADLNAIRGKEYGLYRYVADLYPEPAPYYRALASGGAIGVANLEELQKLNPQDAAKIKQANHDYIQVMPRMKHRTVIGSGNQWQGTAWRDSTGSITTLFAFETFSYPINGTSIVQDITADSIFTVTGRLATRPFHTYLIGDTLTGIPRRTTAVRFEPPQSHPNPFQHATTIRYQLPHSGVITLTIYDQVGRPVRTLVRQRQKAGTYAVRWDGTDETGHPAPNGFYICRLQIGSTRTAASKLLLRRMTH